MPREYQQNSQKGYLLPFSVYMQTLWCVRDYHRLKSLSNENAVEKLEAINNALEQVPEPYREGILGNIIFHSNYGDFAHENTWKLWKQRFVYYVANNLGIYTGDDR